MNKTQLVDALAARMGDRKAAATAVDGLLATIVDTVKGGDSVSITGFGVFEARARAARVARNPRTGETVDVPATTVPAFRPGSGFRTAVGGSAAPAPRTTPARRAAAAAAPAAVAEKPARRSAKAKSNGSFATTAKAPAKAAPAKAAKAAAAKPAAAKAPTKKAAAKAAAAVKAAPAKAEKAAAPKAKKAKAKK
jgi:DNA-binding protein HU-beta